MLFDPQFMLIMLASIVLGLATQGYINATYRKWSHVPLASGLTGSQVAVRILQSNALSSIDVVAVPGHLTDHYDPRAKRLALSEGVFSVPSVASASIAAHEAGHAIQDEQGYVWGRLRTAMVPAVNFGSSAAGVLILLGFFVGITGLLWLGILAYASAVMFQLVTLPVEFDASRRALATLEVSGAIAPDQLPGARQVLIAAALTYVAAALISILNLLYYIGLARGRD
jgi:hypothetical protein